MRQYSGPEPATLHASMKSNGFTEYQHSGGISKNEVRNQINDIAAMINRAKEMKGTVMLNNGKPTNGGTWRHPALDLALQ